MHVGFVSFRIIMLKFQHPSTFLLSGATSSGKTRFTFKLLQNVDVMFQPNQPVRILYCYSEWQSLFESHVDHIRFHRGLPDESDKIFDSKLPSISVLDDLTQETNEFVSRMFTQLSHHRSLSVLYLSQNLFNNQNKFHRTISLNSHYVILFKYPRDTSQIGHMARQVFGNQWRHAVDAFRDATRQAYGYLVFDLHPQTDEEFRLRTQVFPGEVEIIYRPTIKAGKTNKT